MTSAEARSIARNQKAVLSRLGVPTDCLFLGFIVLLSHILYVHELGFYSDDWALLGRMSLSPDQSVTGLFKALYALDVIHMRPMHALYLASLYWLFGLQPLGYQVVNTGMIAAMGILFYLVLRELRQPQVLAVAVPLVYVLLPHYSTDHFWFATFQANLSQSFYFLSLFADLRAVTAGKMNRVWAWKGVALFSLIVSTLAYEVVVPLFLFLNPILSWYHSLKTRQSRPRMRRSTLVALLLTTPLVMILVVLFKFMTTTRLAAGVASPVHMLGLAEQAISVDFGFWGIGLPRVGLKIVSEYPDRAILVSAAILGIAVSGYLYRLAVHSVRVLAGRFHLLTFIAAGFIVFGLGYIICIVSQNIGFTPTGLNNRIAIAAAAGVALAMVGTIGWLASLLPSPKLRGFCFSVLIAALSATGFMINNTLASFWSAAYRRQQEVIAGIRQQFPSLARGSTLILDGICPYVGPAIVFDSSWDLTGVLWLLYDDESLQANVVTPDMTVREDGLRTTMSKVEYRYPYENLVVYDASRKEAYFLPDAETARSYLQKVDASRGSDCPDAPHGSGLPVF